MFPTQLPAVVLSFPTYPLFLVLAVFCGLFLFWRAGRHELFESDFLFDIIVVGALGALIIGRIVEFILFSDRFLWSIKRLVFFNVYPGFNFYGAFFGAILALVIYLKRKKMNFWQIFDLAAAPITFAQSIIFLGKIHFSTIGSSGFWSPESNLALYYFIGYFLIFWSLKRLEAKKRHVGFFFSFYLVAFSIVNLALSRFDKPSFLIAGSVPYNLAVSLLTLFLGGFSWYILTGRNPKEDLKGFFALILLGVFKIKRTLGNLAEADEVAKRIVLLPYYLVRLLYILIRLIWHELTGGIFDFLQALGIRKLK